MAEDERAEDEQYLVQRARRGETAAFEVLVRRYAPFVYNLALRTLNQPGEAEEVAQEAFARAWQGLPRFRAEAAFSTWLYRIVTNLCYNRLPGLKRELAALEPEESPPALEEARPVEARLLAEELGTRLRLAIDELPAQYRLLITLRHLQKMSYSDIAEVTSLPLGTVKTGIHRARHLLRQSLEQYLETDHV
ncbi:MAG: sigma-70 family RNA polymerase sigma factor [Chloroflexi bacterium]|nr:sigma-70 family RNA polymerase sigma factor [Chloroflexota bacterium]MCI0574876.1 sigma-70 family RNA polymerase sigma factor [Chloroflexota bacterium]MCI0648378.1 sigma-70 family RNA polymerase sigma factor [Chloroflexota bacterium]MCI0727499.1 sigma-70 family RNA polymerase sigma factor [Chloroflexota bacterium]